MGGRRREARGRSTRPSPHRGPHRPRRNGRGAGPAAAPARRLLPVRPRRGRPARTRAPRAPARHQGRRRGPRPGPGPHPRELQPDAVGRVPAGVRHEWGERPTHDVEVALRRGEGRLRPTPPRPRSRGRRRPGRRCPRSGRTRAGRSPGACRWSRPGEPRPPRSRAKSPTRTRGDRRVLWRWAARHPCGPRSGRAQTSAGTPGSVNSAGCLVIPAVTAAIWFGEPMRPIWRSVSRRSASAADMPPAQAAS